MQHKPACLQHFIEKEYEFARTKMKKKNTAKITTILIYIRCTHATCRLHSPTNQTKQKRTASRRVRCLRLSSPYKRKKKHKHCTQYVKQMRENDNQTPTKWRHKTAIGERDFDNIQYDSYSDTIESKKSR